jgi:hypothetical protein
MGRHEDTWQPLLLPDSARGAPRRNVGKTGPSRIAHMATCRACPRTRQTKVEPVRNDAVAPLILASACVQMR